jgi:fumarate hydratase class II
VEKTRTETDSLGPVEVPIEAYYGAQTARSLLNFDIGSEKMPLGVVHALALVKKAAARTNARLGVLSSQKAELVGRAADDVLCGALDAHFPLVVWQTGSGTQSNMNVNEVLAGRANELAGHQRGGKSPVHPNDDVNKGQSSNDVFPAAMHVAAVQTFYSRFAPGVERLRSALALRSEHFHGIVKVGRTHLMDATPVTFGQEFSGHEAQVHQGLERAKMACDACLALPLGGTAVGTGLNAHPDFGAECVRDVALLTSHPFRPSENRFADMAAHDALVALSGALRGLAVALVKVANDIRWSASGPRAGLGELTLPENEPGSSIMPGKANPTQAEALIMVCAQVMGNDAAVVFGGASGNFQLNVCKPLIIRNVLHSLELLGDACASFAARCVEGIEVNVTRARHHLNESLMLVTALSPLVGYDTAAKVAHEAYEKGITLKEAALSMGILDEATFDAVVDPQKMIGPEGD